MDWKQSKRWSERAKKSERLSGQSDEKWISKCPKVDQVRRWQTKMSRHGRAAGDYCESDQLDCLWLRVGCVERKRFRPEPNDSDRDRMHFDEHAHGKDETSCWWRQSRKWTLFDSLRDAEYGGSQWPDLPSLSLSFTVRLALEQEWKQKRTKRKKMTVNAEHVLPVKFVCNKKAVEPSLSLRCIRIWCNRACNERRDTKWPTSVGHRIWIVIEMKCEPNWRLLFVYNVSRSDDKETKRKKRKKRKSEFAFVRTNWSNKNSSGKDKKQTKKKWN